MGSGAALLVITGFLLRTCLQRSALCWNFWGRDILKYPQVSSGPAPKTNRFGPEIPGEGTRLNVYREEPLALDKLSDREFLLLIAEGAKDSPLEDNYVSERIARIARELVPKEITIAARRREDA